MAWKKSESGNLEMDANGNPIWTNDAGEDRPVDYLAMSTRLAEVNHESKTRKEELRRLNEKLALFEGVEDLAAWKNDAEKALEALKNAPDKDKELAAQFQARLDAALAPKDKAIAERDQIIAEQKSLISGMKIHADVKDAKNLERLVNPGTKLFLQERLISRGALDDDGKIFYRSAAGEPLYGEAGSYATREEAILAYMKEAGLDAAREFASSDGNTAGSGGLPHGNGGNFKLQGKNFADMSPEEKAAYLRIDANLKRR